MSAQEQIERIIGKARQLQMDWAAKNIGCLPVPHETDFLNAAEREALHRAKNDLPTFAEERAAALARIAKRIEGRVNESDT